MILTGKVNDLRDLLNRGLDINKKIWENNRLLETAIVRQHVPIVKLLLERGASIENPEAGSMSPLRLAAMRYDYRIVPLLLQKGAKPTFDDLNAVMTIPLAGNFPGTEMPRILTGALLLGELVHPFTLEGIQEYVNAVKGPRWDRRALEKIVQLLQEKAAVASISRGQRVYGPSREANVELNQRYPPRLNAIPLDIERELYKYIGQRPLKKGGRTRKSKRTRGRTRKY